MASKPTKFLKNIFSRNKATSGRAPVTLTKSQPKEIFITMEVLKDIGPESPANNRMKFIEELTEDLQLKKLEENAVEALWSCVEDLVQDDVSQENRHKALRFLKALIAGQYSYLEILREYFFEVINDLNHHSDNVLKLELFQTLTKNGKDLQNLEIATGPCLVKWLPSMIESDCLAKFYELLINIVRYNAAHLDENVIASLIKKTCHLVSQLQSDDDIKYCLDWFDKVICYSYLPTQSLPYFLFALCQIVNNAKLTSDCWDLMKKLLSNTHLGYRSIFNLCVMIQNKNDEVSPKIKRSAIYFIGMAIWGSKRVHNLKHSQNSVLPSFKQALVHNPGSDIIMYEVCLNIVRLVRKYGKDLNLVTWNIVFDILEIVIMSSESGESSREVSNSAHDIITEIEVLIRQHHFMGSRDRFFQIVKSCYIVRPESSVTMLMRYLSQSIAPTTSDWINNLNNLMNKFFRQDQRTAVRQEALSILMSCINTNKLTYENELIEVILLPCLMHIESDENIEIRKRAADVMISLCNSSSPCVLDLFVFIEKIIMQPYIRMTKAKLSQSMECLYKAEDLYSADVQVAVLGLVDLIQVNLYRCPPTHFIRAYDLLIQHLKQEYSQSFLFSTAAVVRKSAIELLMKIRVDSYNRVGFMSSAADQPIKFSPYIVCKLRDKEPLSSPIRSPSPTKQAEFSFTDALEIFILCLHKESDWSVLSCLIAGLPETLRNKTLVLSAQPHLVNDLCERLCEMVKNKGPIETLTNIPEVFTQYDFHGCILMLLASFVSYHFYLLRENKTNLIKCLTFGLYRLSKSSKICADALRLSSLEMQEIMARHISEVLLILSKISATVTMAIPVLAFLSGLVHLPKMYANFIDTQYHYVFAIALPYTNPFKFSHFAVSLAHHVIAMWFVHCRVPFRKRFAKFIQTGLRGNVQQHYKENQHQGLTTHPHDRLYPRDRSRGASWTDTTSVRKRNASGPSSCQSDTSNCFDVEFHMELIETCIDMMSRYVYGNHTNTPKRSPLVEFLLSGGACESWLVGNKLITITTSGQGRNIGKLGFCDKCIEKFAGTDVNAQKSVSDASGDSSRRRHKSAACSRAIPIPDTHRVTQDDINIRHSASDSSGNDIGAISGELYDAEPSLTARDAGTVDSFESFLKGVRNQGSNLAVHLCSCWCSGWAEVHIRSPSGNLSWIMRSQNSQMVTNGNEFYSDIPLADISLLFCPTQDTSSKIDSESLEEAQYDSLHDSHFSPSPASNIDIAQFEDSENLPSEMITKTRDLSPLEEELSIPYGVLRKTQSSPSLIDDGNNGSSNYPSTIADDFSRKDADNQTIFSVEMQDVNSDGAEMTEDTDPTPNRTSTQSDNTLDVSDIGLSSTAFSRYRKQGVHKNTCESDFIATFHTKSEQFHVSHKKLHSSKSVGANMRPNIAVLEANRKKLRMFGGDDDDDSFSETIPDEPRRRVHTISSPDSRDFLRNREHQLKSIDTSQFGMNPRSVFLQLYHSSSISRSKETPVILPKSEVITRTTNILDRIYPYETHKIGVLYVGEGQVNDESAILHNLYGSSRYVSFLEGLGELIRLRDCDETVTYIGGLDVNGHDGEFAYLWREEIMNVIYHIATLMPNRPEDPKCNAKKRHIGNDFVTIVYNDSEENYMIGTIKGDVNYVNIVITPLDCGSNAVTIQTKDVPSLKKCITSDISDFLGHDYVKIISDDSLALLVRQMAIHCNLASHVIQRQSSEHQDPFASNWLERLRTIKRIRAKFNEKKDFHSELNGDQWFSDFTTYL